MSASHPLRKFGLDFSMTVVDRCRCDKADEERVRFTFWCFEGRLRRSFYRQPPTQAFSSSSMPRVYGGLAEDIPSFNMIDCV
jgi:hypothetical protein